MVVVRVLVVRLQEVVIHVLGSQLHLDPIDPEGFELQHGHGAGGILKEGVVDA